MNRQTRIDTPLVNACTGDLLVSYPGRQFSRARREIRRLLSRAGDPEPRVMKSAVWGIALVQTTLNSREVIRRCRELSREEPGRNFQFAIKWVPVDYWCESELAIIRQLLEERIRDRIGEQESWAMRVRKRRWERYHTLDIITALAPAIPRKVDLSHPDWIVWVDVVGSRTAVSLLRAEEIFSVVQY